MGRPLRRRARKLASIHTQTYYRWRKEYGGLKLDQTVINGTAEVVRALLDAGADPKAQDIIGTTTINDRKAERKIQ